MNGPVKLQQRNMQTFVVVAIRYEIQNDVIGIFLVTVHRKLIGPCYPHIIRY